MNKIVYQTEEWGGENVVHIEIDWNGNRMTVTVENDKVVIHTVIPITTKKQNAVNQIIVVREK